MWHLKLGLGSISKAVLNNALSFTYFHIYIMFFKIIKEMPASPPNVLLRKYSNIYQKYLIKKEIIYQMCPVKRVKGSHNPAS